MVFAYAIINQEGNSHRFYISPNRIDSTIANHLSGLEFKDYSKITDDITTFSNEGKKIWISPMSSFAIYNAVSNKVAPYITFYHTFFIVIIIEKNLIFRINWY